MRPQVVLRELPLYVLVDFLHVGRVRDATEPSARRPHHQRDLHLESFLRARVAPLIHLRRYQDAQKVAEIRL